MDEVRGGMAGVPIMSPGAAERARTCPDAAIPDARGNWPDEDEPLFTPLELDSRLWCWGEEESRADCGAED